MKSLQQIDIVLNPDNKHWREIVEWCSKTEGWKLRVEDYSIWKKSFEKFWFYMGIDRDSQEAVSSVCLAYERSASGKPEEDVYYIGSYYVRPKWRNCGLGSLLFEKVLKIAGDENVSLNGTLKMMPRYASKYGFDKMPNYRHNFVTIPTENLLIPTGDPEYAIKDLKEVEEKDVIAYDIGISHRRRSKYLLNFMTTGDCFAKVALDSTGKVVGFGCVRIVCTNDLRAGPFYADNQAVARSLLAGILNAIPELRTHKLFVSVYPTVNEEADRLFESMGGGHVKIEPFTQCQFKKRILPTNDVKVFGMIASCCIV